MAYTTFERENNGLLRATQGNGPRNRTRVLALRWLSSQTCICHQSFNPSMPLFLLHSSTCYYYITYFILVKMLIKHANFQFGLPHIFKTDFCSYLLLTVSIKQDGILVKDSLWCQGDPGPGSAPKDHSALIILSTSLNFTFLTSKSECSTYLR